MFIFLKKIKFLDRLAINYFTMLHVLDELQLSIYNYIINQAFLDSEMYRITKSLKII